MIKTITWKLPESHQPATDMLLLRIISSCLRSGVKYKLLSGPGMFTPPLLTASPSFCPFTHNKPGESLAQLGNICAKSFFTPFSSRPLSRLSVLFSHVHTAANAEKGIWTPNKSWSLKVHSLLNTHLDLTNKLKWPLVSLLFVQQDLRWRMKKKKVIFPLWESINLIWTWYLRQSSARVREPLRATSCKPSN